MSIIAPSVGESFTFRLRSTITGNPQVKWFNTWEARSFAATSYDGLVELAERLAAFQQGLMYSPYEVDQATISTWAPDGEPYNPDSFVTIPYTGMTGAKVIGINEALDLRVCLYVKRTAQSGRIGRLFLRGCLTESDVNSFAGVFRLADPVAMASDVTEGVTTTGLDRYFTDGSSQPHLCLIGRNQVTREITGLESGGVAVVKLNHKWFNRRVTTGPNP